MGKGQEHLKEPRQPFCTESQAWGPHSQVPGVILCLHVLPSVHPHTSPTKRDSILMSYSQLFRHG